MDITTRRNGHNDKGVVPTGLEDETVGLKAHHSSFDDD